MGMSPPAIMKGRKRGEQTHTETHTCTRKATAATAASASWPLYSSSALMAHTAALHPRRDVPGAATAGVRHGNLGVRVPAQPQPGGHERKGTKQGCICSETKDICPWPEQLSGTISQGQRLRMTDTRLVVNKTSRKVLGCPNVC